MKLHHLFLSWSKYFEVKGCIKNYILFLGVTFWGKMYLYTIVIDYKAFNAIISETTVIQLQKKWEQSLTLVFQGKSNQITEIGYLAMHYTQQCSKYII